MFYNTAFGAVLSVLYSQGVVVFAIAEHLFCVALVVTYFHVGYLAFRIGNGFVYGVHKSFVWGYVQFRIAFFYFFVQLLVYFYAVFFYQMLRSFEISLALYSLNLCQELPDESAHFFVVVDSHIGFAFSADEFHNIVFLSVLLSVMKERHP